MTVPVMTQYPCTRLILTSRRLKTFLSITLFCLTIISLYGQNQPTRYADAYLTSINLIPGEQTLLWVGVRGGRADRHPQLPEVDGAAINFTQEGVRMGSNRELTQFYIYRVSAPNPGKYIIPPITIYSNGKKLLTDPLVFQVHPLSKLQTIPTGVRSHDVKIGWFPTKTSPYEGEICPIVLKVYTPSRLRVSHFGLPDPQKVNCLAWRFSLPNNRRALTTVINGEIHQVMRYATTMSGIAAGSATLGPTKLRLIIRESIIDPQHGSKLEERPIHLTLPELKFDILALPENAPESFNGAVGRFQISATCQKTSLKETDSTEVILHIEGTGNLPTVKAPILSDTSWDIIDTSKVTRGEERRFTSGRVTFRQLLRPSSSKITSIPPYTFSYFDPNDQKYHLLETPAIPVNITASTLATTTNTHNNTNSPSPDTPAENMQDIMAFIDRPQLRPSALIIHYSPLYHLIPATLACLILGVAIRQRQRRRRLLNPEAGEKKLALAKLTEASDTRTFYRRAGRIIDRWHHGGTGQPQLKKILAERDTLCFQPDGSAIEDISPERKSSIINTLKRSTKLIIFLTLLSLTTDLPAVSSAVALAKEEAPAFKTARDAWKIGNYQQAITLYQKEYPNPQQTPADILYNIGNCHYRLGQPGLAALAWRRALVTDPAHQQARKNLRFIEISQNANTPSSQPWQSYLAFTDTKTYYTLLYTSGWIIALTTLFMFLNRKKRSITPTIIVICLAGAMVCASTAAIIFHPDSHISANPEKRAVITQNTPLFSDANRLTATSTELPQASLVTINAQRGPWTHISTFDKHQGWVETVKLTKIITREPNTQ